MTLIISCIVFDSKLNHISMQLCIFCILSNSFSDALRYDLKMEMVSMNLQGYQTSVVV